MLSSITSSPGGSAGLAGASASDAASLQRRRTIWRRRRRARPVRSPKRTQPELSLSISQTTEISISQTSSGGAKAESRAAGPTSAQALSPWGVRRWAAPVDRRAEAQAEGKDREDQGGGRRRKGRPTPRRRPTARLANCRVDRQGDQVDVLALGRRQVGDQLRPALGVHWGLVLGDQVDALGLAHGAGDVEPGQHRGVAVGLAGLFQRLAPALAREVIGLAGIDDGRALLGQAGDDEVGSRRRQEAVLLEEVCRNELAGKFRTAEQLDTLFRTPAGSFGHAPVIQVGDRAASISAADLTKNGLSLTM